MAEAAFRHPASKILPILRDEICSRPPSSAPFLHPTSARSQNISSLIERSEAERTTWESCCAICPTVMESGEMLTRNSSHRRSSRLNASTATESVVFAGLAGRTAGRHEAVGMTLVHCDWKTLRRRTHLMSRDS